MTKEELRKELVFADEDIVAVVVYHDSNGSTETVAFFKDVVDAEAFCEMAHKELATDGTWEVIPVVDA